MGESVRTGVFRRRVSLRVWVVVEWTSDVMLEGGLSVGSAALEMGEDIWAEGMPADLGTDGEGEPGEGETDVVEDS